MLCFVKEAAQGNMTPLKHVLKGKWNNWVPQLVHCQKGLLVAGLYRDFYSKYSPRTIDTGFKPEAKDAFFLKKIHSHF